MSQAQITADKMTVVFQFIGMMDQKDVDLLGEMNERLEAQTSQLRSVQGVLVDYDRAEHQMKWNKQAQDRIKGVLLIRNAMLETPEKIDAKEATKEKEDIAKMFGL